MNFVSHLFETLTSSVMVFPLRGVVSKNKPFLYGKNYGRSVTNNFLKNTFLFPLFNFKKFLVEI